MLTAAIARREGRDESQIAQIGAEMSDGEIRGRLRLFSVSDQYGILSGSIADRSESIDIATGCFEISAFLTLNGKPALKAWIELSQGGNHCLKRTLKTTAILPGERIEQVILLLRDQRVIIDADLARLYGVTTKRLNEQVKRNPTRFPEDFMFELSPAG